MSVLDNVGCWALNRFGGKESIPRAATTASSVSTLGTVSPSLSDGSTVPTILSFNLSLLALVWILIPCDTHQQLSHKTK